KEGGQGAYFYVCGRTAFASSVMDAVRDIIARYAEGITEGERAEVGRQTLYRLIGEDRFMLEIFTTYAGAHFDERKQQYPISEVIMHNNDDLGYWIIVSGRVYDMNEFNHMHPGGAKIIQSYSGMDATLAYQKIEHHLNSEVDAMLGMYELGVLCAPDFGNEWGTALSPKGLRLITLRDAYYAWVDLLYMLVEVENAIRNDFRVRYEPFTDIETHHHVLLTPTKVQQLGLTHERLVTSYLPHVLGEPIETLWTISIGLLGHSELDAGWMRHQLERIHGSDEAQAVNNIAAVLRERIKHDEQRLSDANGYVEHKYGAFCALLEHEDTRLLRELKLALRDGLMVFEELERDTIRGGGSYIVAALKRVPTILEDFYTRLYERL
ncbi:MAG: hypothetical protein H7175_12430, partial [Burkholderiales bacterium]|nr:hypothetical protein [Anaerolineae bacterium]